MFHAKILEKKCYLCGSLDFKQITNRLRKNEFIPVLECRNCGFIFLDTSHPNFITKSYRDRDYLEQHSELYGDKSISSYDEIRRETYRAKAEQLLLKLSSESEVLEIGCGSGSFLSLILWQVKSAVGIELNEILANYAREKLKITIYTEPIESVKLNQRFDAIFMFHLIEHLKDPIAVLKFIRAKYLKEDGFIWIECPNTDEALMRFLPKETQSAYRKFNYHLDHFWYFNESTLAELLRKAGLRSNITTVHDYTLLNFLNWWFTGRPSADLKAGQLDSRLYPKETDQFMRDINNLFLKTEIEFKSILKNHDLASTLVCEARQ